MTLSVFVIAVVVLVAGLVILVAAGDAKLGAVEFGRAAVWVGLLAVVALLCGLFR